MGKNSRTAQTASVVHNPSEKRLLRCFGTHGVSARLTNKVLQPLCHEHHLAMRLIAVPLHTGRETAQTLVYACTESNCSVRYNSSSGYFVVAQQKKLID